MDGTHLGAVLLQGLDLFLLLVFAQLLLSLELRLLGSEIFEANLVVLLLLLLLQPIDGFLVHLGIRITYIVIVGDFLVLGEVPVDLGSEVEGAVGASWPAL